MIENRNHMERLIYLIPDTWYQPVSKRKHKSQLPKRCQTQFTYKVFHFSILYFPFNYRKDSRFSKRVSEFKQAAAAKACAGSKAKALTKGKVSEGTRLYPMLKQAGKLTEADALSLLPPGSSVTKTNLDNRWKVVWRAFHRSRSWTLYGEVEAFMLCAKYIWTEYSKATTHACPFPFVNEVKDDGPDWPHVRTSVNLLLLIPYTPQYQYTQVCSFENVERSAPRVHAFGALLVSSCFCQVSVDPCSWAQSESGKDWCPDS